MGILNFTFIQLHEMMEKGLKLMMNIPETFYYIDGESFFMHTAENGIINHFKINQQVDSKGLIEKMYQTTKRMQYNKTSMSGCFFPVTIGKSTDLTENDLSLQFFIGSALERVQSEVGKSNFIVQRYIVSKGLGCSLIRATLKKEPHQTLKNAKIQFFRIGTPYRYDGEDEISKDYEAKQKGKIQSLNFRKLKAAVEKSRNMKFIQRFLKE